uniref:Secreted protein n=1 Tax=Globodera pallida TaxID=36090 RepID=A0A183BLG1_GLOPA
MGRFAAVTRLSDETEDTSSPRSSQTTHNGKSSHSFIFWAPFGHIAAAAVATVEEDPPAMFELFTVSRSFTAFFLLIWWPDEPPSSAPFTISAPIANCS